LHKINNLKTNNCRKNGNSKNKNIDNFEYSIAFIELSKNSIDQLYEEYVKKNTLPTFAVNPMKAPMETSIEKGRISKENEVNNQIEIDQQEIINKDILLSNEKDVNKIINNDWFSSIRENSQKVVTTNGWYKSKFKQNPKLKKPECLQLNSEDRQIEIEQKVKALDEIIEIFCRNLNHLPRHYVVNAFKVNNYRVIETFKFLVNYFKKFKNNK